MFTDKNKWDECRLRFWLNISYSRGLILQRIAPNRMWRHLSIFDSHVQLLRRQGVVRTVRVVARTRCRFRLYSRRRFGRRAVQVTCRRRLSVRRFKMSHDWSIDRMNLTTFVSRLDTILTFIWARNSLSFFHSNASHQQIF